MAANHLITSTNLFSKCITAITLLCLLNGVWGLPPPFKPPGYPDSARLGYDDLEDKCKTEESAQILCQTCAKVTKSEIVYPMCCTNKEDARVWCDRYTSFGIQ